MKIVVTGGCGFIGVPLVRRLIEADHVVLVLDNFAVGNRDRLPKAEGLVVSEVDIRDNVALGENLDDFQPEMIFHLAALHFIPYCNQHPLETLQVNVTGSRNVFRIGAERLQAPIVFVSSGAVYPVTDQPCSENLAAGPTDFYGFSKWFGELLLRSYCAANRTPGVIARLFNVYGPGETNPHVIPHILEQLAVGRFLELGNLVPRRDYIYLDDAVSMLLQLMDLASPDCPIFNVGTGRGYSVRDVIDRIEILLGETIEVETRSALVRSNDRPFLVADPAKLVGVAGLKAARSLEDGLRELLAEEGFRLA